MALFAISDLHLALNEDKPMDIFGNNWIEHDKKIKKNWLKKITKEDTVLIAGDISWSMKINEGMEDLNWIHKLPGKKIISKGNHDYWWGSIIKLNSLYDDMKFIQNNFYNYEDYAICGTRGWPIKDNSSEHDKKIMSREIIRLKLSLDEAKKNNFNKYIVMMHYPPVNDRFEESEFTKIFKEYGVEKVIYGHIHGPALKNVFQGKIDNIEYILTSCDYINFNPIRII
ncbi:3',5'-cyclic adenosine monophosphate phosphodiesterase CpdA [Clostridium acetireducens DSM 10703]|uniref:3',5'-cyclic adenosine monophosphate phosphodiesterase CpdA n=1 Tax=Clostridium acetireducens DSM 10703 TaxID=1121290 RepID=A0A1E8EWM9_9CLOT|nr:metallophosphoesterase [Clostridium acetireducens]OFI05039.1 3',5'-cyclic adenosine monophosphate phosphodiesterase CpdA [Clostridium acetireducens DSM 10703]